MTDRVMNAGISLDLDNLWSYMKIHGDSGWESYPSYFDIFIPEVITILKEADLIITFFIVGRDAELYKNRDGLQMLLREGHEFGNHSYNHDSWMHKYDELKIDEELIKTEEALYTLGSKKPLGFRGPGFCYSNKIINKLAVNKYLYDASTLPTFIGPAARYYYFRQSKLTKEQKLERNELFGKFSDGYKKLKPYFLYSKNGDILELPVTTIPLIKIPFHLSYLLYLSRISENMMLIYLRSAVELCRITNTPLSFLLHPLDLLGGDKLSMLKFFPGMDISSKKKRELFLKVIRILSDNFELISTDKLAEKIVDNKKNNGR